MDLSAAAEDRSSGEVGDDADPKSELLAGRVVSSEAHRPQDGEHQFQKAISAWRSINLSKLVPELDTTATTIIESQREALVQRKELAQKTKDFRKLDDAIKLIEVKVLLKAYQTFIDLLTTHGKASSSGFLQLYSTISEAPDPYPLLEASVDSLLVSEETVPRIVAENEHLQTSVSNLTHDLERVEQQLNKEQSARKHLEDSLGTKSQEIEASWQAVLEEKKDNWEAKGKSLEEKLENQDRLLSELKASYEVSQRMGHGASGDNENYQPSASAAELEIITSDLERTSQRLAEVEGRNEQLRLELAQASSNKPQRSPNEEDPIISRLRSENASLIRKLDAIKYTKGTESREWADRIRSLERDTNALQQDRDEMRERLQQWRDYPDIKRELEVFKAIEFSTGDEDEPGLEDHSEERELHKHKLSQRNGMAVGNHKETLEQLLLARNKKLADEMAVLRVSHQELQRDLANLQEAMSTTNAELERTQNLNATLENDLVNVQQHASNTFPASTRSISSRYPNSGGYGNSLAGGRVRRTSPTSSIISGFDPRNDSYDTLEAVRSGEPVGGGSGILPMVQAQRDRFKQKNSQLEQEVSKQYSIVTSLRQEVASLQKDNLSLYEKTRYVSTYNRGQQASSASTYSQNPHSTSIRVSTDTPSGLSMDRYQSAYEANISPFAAFRGREASRAYKRMSLPERMIFSVTRIVLANRTSRNVFAAYCVGLHVLIFVMLYWMQTVDIQNHASNLGEAVKEVGRTMGQGVGGDASHGDWQQEGLQGGRPG